MLKDGRTVARDLPARDTPTAEVIRLMTGRTIEYVFPRADPRARRARWCSRSTGSAGRGEFADVSFTVRAGEVVGLAGLVGSGRSEILETVYGARRATAGTVRVRGRALRAGSVPAAVRAGMGLAPGGAQEPGPAARRAGVPQRVAARAAPVRAGRLPRPRRELAAAGEVTAQLDVRPPDPARPVRTLSGGNQQKVVLARWLLQGCDVLLLDEPTRGVDVGARSEIYALIRQLADAGRGGACWSPARCPRCSAWPTGCWSCAKAGSCTRRPSAELDEGRVLDLVMEGSAHG